MLSVVILALGVFSGEAGSAQNGADEQIIGSPWSGEAGNRETTRQIMARERTNAVPRVHRVFPFRRRDATASPNVSSASGSLAVSPSLRVAQTFGTSFTGATLADCSGYPPDTMGAVGPSQFIIALNGRIRSFNKNTGTADGAIDAGTDAFFSSVMTPPTANNFTSDPRIRYDRLSGRWFIIMIDVPGQLGTQPNRVMIAMSDSNTITGGTVWTFFQFQHDLVSPAGDTGDFADYPTLGIDANALYIGVNVFATTGSESFVNTTVFVVRKSSLLSGGPIVVTAFRGLITGHRPVNRSGPYTPQGVDNYDPAATEGYIIGIDITSSSELQLLRVSDPGGTPSLSGNVSISVATFATPITVPHLGNTGGTSGYLDGLDDRLLAAHFRNGFLWTSQNVGVDNAGNPSSVTRNGVRWYQLTGIPTGQTPSVTQSGTIFQASASNTSDQRSYWMGTIMVSGQGHAAAGFSSASANEYANAAATGRLAADAAGSMNTPALYTASSTAYNPSDDPGGSSGRRWGDYSYTSLDPSDDMTIWTIQEWCSSANTYAVQILKLIAPPPATPTNCTPSSVKQGASNVVLTVTGFSSTNGAGFFDPGAGFSNRIAAAISGGGVTINSVTYNNPTNLALNLSVSGAAATGPRTVIVTNPDGQSVTNSSGILSVISSSNNPPVLTAISNKTVNEQQTLSFTNSASDPDGNALTFSLDVGAPTNAVVNPTNGVFAWTPTEAQGPSTNAMKVIVTDNGVPSLSATQSFTVFVTEVNVAPSLTPVSDKTVTEGVLLTFTNSASDADIPANTLTFSLANAPSNATINAASGVFTWTPSEAQGPSSNFISVIVTDNGVPSLSATQSFTVTVLESNLPPALVAIANRTIHAGTTLAITNSATDPDIPGNTLTFSLDPVVPTGAAIGSSSGVFTWTPDDTYANTTNTINVRVTDNGTPSLSATQSFTVFVLETNSAPMLAVISNYTVFEGETLTFTNSATDADIPANLLTFSLENMPTNATVNPTNGVFTWTPTEAQGPSSNFISVIVTDNGVPSLSATQSFTIFVLESNLPPALVAVANRTIHAGTTLAITNSATDPDIPGNTLTFSLDPVVPTGAAIGPASGVFTWTPDDTYANTTNTINVRVTDNGSPNLSDTKSFLVTVASRPFFESIVVSDGVASVVWSSISGQAYRLQRNDDVNGTNWTDVTNVVAVGQTTSVNVLIGPADRGFYRVTVLP
ncbi:MAG TPA: putative Ig domain-containing protein [Verrucomicrobiae bacterium]